MQDVLGAPIRIVLQFIKKYGNKTCKVFVRNFKMILKNPGECVFCFNQTNWIHLAK